MVEIVAYKPQMLPMLHEMFDSQRYLNTWQIQNETLPAIGFIAIRGDDEKVVPVAAGFLRRVEGGFAQLDSLVSNAKQSSEIRHAGISACVDALIQEAKNLNLYGILATVKDKSTIERAISIGFRLIEDQKLIALSLKEIP